MAIFFFFSSRRRHTRWPRDWSSDVCSSDLRRECRSQRFKSARAYHSRLSSPFSPTGLARGNSGASRLKGQSAVETIEAVLPDGAVRAFPRGTPLSAIAEDFDPSLAGRAIAALVDGVAKDIYLPLQQSGRLEFITPESPRALGIYRHTTSHLLANAVKDLFPEVKIGIGPATEDGFFYDFERPTPFTPEDLARIEAKMREIKARDFPIRRVEQPKEEALAYFRGQGDTLKVELVSEKGGPIVSCYRQDTFMDFCTGPHVPSTGRLGAFKLLSLAGAYWKGSETNPQLQRIYGTAFAKEEELKAHL